jgi:catechol 2,3-dioxygenase-like lactoylglutathione lyase family enzyme
MKICEMVKQVRHVGIIVDDVQASIELYKKIYDIGEEEIRVMPPFEEKDAESRFAFIPLGGQEFELIQPISFTVTDIEKAVERMKEKGVRLGHVTKDGILDMKRSKVAYFNPEDTGGILVEYVEPVED